MTQVNNGKANILTKINFIRNMLSKMFLESFKGLNLQHWFFNKISLA